MGRRVIRRDRASSVQGGGYKVWMRKGRGREVLDGIWKKLVGRDGIEPPTPGLSVLCSLGGAYDRPKPPAFCASDLRR